MARASTGMAFGKIAGRMGDFVVVEGRSGLAIRRAPVYKRSSSPRQRAASDRLRAATAIWNTLSAAQAQAWNAYAAGLTHHNPMTGEAYAPIGFNVFTGLAMRTLQVNPAATVPLVPPVGAFVGDAITVSIAPVTGAVRFVASGPNRPGVVTELLTQRLANVRRRPSGNYVSAAFAGFVAGGLTRDVPTTPGVYACAIRFVEPTTGRATGLQPLGVITVP